MRLFIKLQSLFIKTNYITNDIININSTTIIPSDLSREEIIILNSYKEEYLNQLKTKRHIISKEIRCDTIHSNLNMYINLLLNLCFDTNEVVYKNELYLKVLKLKRYYENILEIEKEVIIRINALKEILGEKVIFSHNKKQVLLYEINNLISVYNIILSNKLHIKIEIDNYLKKYENNDLSAEDEELYLKKKLYLIKKIAKYVMPNYHFNNSNVILDIVYLEIEFEKYAYNYQEEITEIKNKYSNIVKRYNYYTIRSNNFLEEIEAKYLLYYNYTRGLINDQDLLSLYEDKLLSEIANDSDEFGGIYSIFNKRIITEDTPDLTRKCYENAVMKLIGEIVIDKYGYLKNRFGNNRNVAINYIIKILKDGLDKLDPERILNDKLLMNILKCSLYPFLFDYFLKKYVINIENNNIKDDFVDHTLINNKVLYELNSGLELESNLCLTSLFQIDNIMKNIDIDYLSLEKYTVSNNRNKNNHRLYYLYKIYKLINKNEFIKENKNHQKLFYFPEGITKINIDKPNNPLKIFFKDIDDSIVFLPSTLKSIHGDLFAGHKIKDIKLNEGLEEIGNHSFASQMLDSITIPSSVNYINSRALNSATKIMIFNDFEDSKLLHSEYCFKTLLKDLITWCIHKSCVGEKGRKAEIFIELKIYQIILENSNKHYTFNLSQRKYSAFLPEKYTPNGLNWLEENCTAFYYNHLQNIIYNRTGFKIGKGKVEEERTKTL